MEEYIYDLIAMEVAGESLSDEERTRLKEWRASSAANEEDYQRLYRLKRPVVSIQESGGVKYDTAYRLVEREIARRARSRRLKQVRYGLRAAMVILLMGLGVGIWLKPDHTYENQPLMFMPNQREVLLTMGGGRVMALSGEYDRVIVSDSSLRIMQAGNVLTYSGHRVSDTVEYNTLTVPVGAEYRVRLSDGTQVFLNSGSELRYPVAFPEGAREVYLQGEAWFEVAGDSLREFLVHTDEMRIKVLGTSFNVNTYPQVDQVHTTLVTGTVEIACADETFRMKAGQQLLFDRKERHPAVRSVDTELFTSWKDGYYKFRETSLEEIMSTLSLWYGVKVVFRQEEARNLEFTGRVKRYEDAWSFLRLLEETRNVVFELKEQTIYIRVK